MRTGAPSTIVVGTLVGVLILAGCGSSGGSSTGSSSNKAQFVAKADAICKTTDAQTTPLVNQITANAASLETGNASAARKVTTAVAQLHVDATAALAKLHALSQPSASRKPIQKFLMPLASIVDSIGEAATALRHGQIAVALSLLQGAQPLAQQVTDAARSYGLSQCESVISALG